MREILFRGKAKKGDWVFGNLVIQDGEMDESGKSSLDYSILGSRGKWDYLPNPESIGEYCGLCDKNGKQIFEGDIVKYGDTVHEVVFEQRNSTAYFGLVYSSTETLPFGYYQDLKQIEVIGNIHDNPELLKECEDGKAKKKI